MIGQRKNSKPPIFHENTSGSSENGTTIEATSATPARNRIFFCKPGSRSRDTENPKIVPGADCGSRCAMSPSGVPASCWGAYGFDACG
jgi:hypothetical protein